MILDEITMQKILFTENPQKGGKDSDLRKESGNARVYFLKRGREWWIWSFVLGICGNFLLVKLN